MVSAKCRTLGEQMFNSAVCNSAEPLGDSFEAPIGLNATELQ